MVTMVKATTHTTTITIAITFTIMTITTMTTELIPSVERCLEASQNTFTMRNLLLVRLSNTATRQDKVILRAVKVEPARWATAYCRLGHTYQRFADRPTTSPLFHGFKSDMASYCERLHLTVLASSGEEGGS